MQVVHNIERVGKGVGWVAIGTHYRQAQDFNGNGGVCISIIYPFKTECVCGLCVCAPFLGMQSIHSRGKSVTNAKQEGGEG